jgi:catechol 2,3-dioxygenase-like lactoylglutathione lyase family enzyme
MSRAGFPGEPDRSRPCGVSHVAVVTADLDAFRAFYEDVIGLRTSVVFGAGPGHAREALMAVGDGIGGAMLQVFEVAGDDRAAHGATAAMFQRGHLDHFGFTVPNRAALTALRDRLLAVGATSGDIRPLGPMLSLRFADPDGCQGEINCFNDAFDESLLRSEDEVIDPDWVGKARRILHAEASHPPSGGTS